WAAAATRSVTRATESSSEHSEWVCRCTNPAVRVTKQAPFPGRRRVETVRGGGTSGGPAPEVGGAVAALTGAAQPLGVGVDALVEVVGVPGGGVPVGVDRVQVRQGRVDRVGVVGQV